MWSPLDKLRTLRNKLSHSWNSALLSDFFKERSLIEMDGFDEVINAHPELTIDSTKHPEAALRVRLFWLLSRLFYETRYYHKAKTERLDPYSALYGPNHPKYLGKIAEYAITMTKLVTPSDIRPQKS